MNATNRLPVASLTDFVTSLLRSAGMRAGDATLCADAFVLQEMRGVTTHGLRRVKPFVDQLLAGRLKAQAQYEVVSDDGATVVLDGHGGAGMVACMAAMDRTIAKARAYGIGIATVRNNTHFLAAAPYCLRAVEAGHIGLAMSNSYGAMAYPGTNQKTLGNAPMGYGIPGDPFPLVFDAAMTISAGKLQRGGAKARRSLTGCRASTRKVSRPTTHLRCWRASRCRLACTRAPG